MIETRGLVHRYGDTTAINSVSLKISDDEFVILAGSNGSGKTTLIHHFNGLLEPDEGEVLVNGVDVQEDLLSARSSIGMVFQSPENQVVASTVSDDVAFGPENLGLDRSVINRRVEESLEAVDLREKMDANVLSLSGGEVQRLAIAGALAMEPDHLVLDEPLTGLDKPAFESFMEYLESVETSVVLVTHDIRDVLGLADRVVALKDGEVAIDTDPGEALDDLPGLGVRVE